METIKPSGIKLWLISVRAFSITATAIPFLTLLLISINQSLNPNYGQFALGLIAVVFLQFAVNLFNDFEDYKRGVDLPGEFGGSQVIQKKWQSPELVKISAWVTTFVGVLLGIYLLVTANAALDIKILLVIAAFLGVLGYSNPPFGLKYRGLGDILVFLTVGPLLTLGAAVVMNLEISTTVICLGSIYGLLAVGLLHANNFQDSVTDQQRGANTLAVRLGFQNSKIFLASIYVATYLIWLYLWNQNLIGWITLLGQLIVLVPIIKMLIPAMKAKNAGDSQIAQIKMQAAVIHFLSGIIFILTQVLEIIL